MNRFVRTLVAVAVVTLSLAAFGAGNRALGLVAPAAAQSGPGGPQGGRPNQRFGEMLLSLKPPLTDDQKSRIRAIVADARAKAKSLTDIQAKRDAMRAGFAKIRTVLTPPQQAEMKAQFDKSRSPRGSSANNS